MLRAIRKIGAWIIVIITVVFVVSAIVTESSLSLLFILPIMVAILFSWGIGLLILEKIFS